MARGDLMADTYWFSAVAFVCMLAVSILQFPSTHAASVGRFSDRLEDGLQPCHLFTDGSYRCLSGCRKPAPEDTVTVQGLRLSHAAEKEIVDSAFNLLCTGERSRGQWSRSTDSTSRLGKNRNNARDYFSTCLFAKEGQTFECATGPSCLISSLGRVVCKGGSKVTGLYSGGANETDPIVLENRILPKKDEPLYPRTA